ncbi:MAG: TAT-variant-translocated molybdopterin oxidoreductase [Lentisphaeria bacterium]|nr:TAT-variant-translocated molybdopterin oxidoreductase [Lentisphaeria bacterium]
MSPMNNEKKRYWRSLDDLAGSPDVRNHKDDEFPNLKRAQEEFKVSRRNFLKIVGAGGAVAGITGCRRPVNKILPYGKQPEEIVPGRPLYYASSWSMGEDVLGIVVESHEGRPTKIEGNPLHPANSNGGTNAWAQTAVLDLWDADRLGILLQDPENPRDTRNKNAADFQRLAFEKQSQKSLDDFYKYIAGRKEAWKANAGEGVVIFSDQVISPTQVRLIKELQEELPKLKWVAWEPVNNEQIYAGVKLATGKALRPIYHYDKAKTILALDANFLGTESDLVRNTQNFVATRNVDSGKKAIDMSRLYSFECNFSQTGGQADHRVKMKTSEIYGALGALVAELKSQGLDIDLDIPATVPTKLKKEVLSALASDLIGSGKRSLVVAGRTQPAEVHAAVIAINDALDSVGTTIEFVEPEHSILSDTAAFNIALEDINNGKVQDVFFLNTNPAYSLGSSQREQLKTALSNVPNSVTLGLLYNETAALTNWFVPTSHFLESWGDVISYQGTPSLVQPLIQPLYGTINDIDFVMLIKNGKLDDLDEKNNSVIPSYVELRNTWKEFGATNEKQWQRALHDGIKSRKDIYSSKSINVDSDAINAAYKNLSPVSGIEINVIASTSVYDGRLANNGFLQEMPGPVTKLTWDNAAMMSPKMAKSLGVDLVNKEGVGEADLVNISVGKNTFSIAAIAVPGHADDAITIELGYGRKDFKGRVGGIPVGDWSYIDRKTDAAIEAFTFDDKDLAGFDVNEIRTTASDYVMGGEVKKTTAEPYVLALTQDHQSMEMRALVREANLDSWQKEPKTHTLAPVPHDPPFEDNAWGDPFDYSKGYQWGMTIDLQSCTGCNACLVACQSENNIPVVGKRQVSLGRELHWIRIDRYFSDSKNRSGIHDYDYEVDEDPQMVYQPVPCQHCENAPCEQVCPVAATVHTPEGLNGMTYNRCIGTRYCGNNCPYKVRRFNFYNFTKDTPESVQQGMNPDVTVRFRGVMEKCTFCVQRINQARIDSKLAKTEIGDKDLKAACQQACPAGSITFGNINNEKSAVAKKKKLERNYTILGELNTRPRTSYLGRVRNPHPKLVASTSHDKHEQKGH